MSTISDSANGKLNKVDPYTDRRRRIADDRYGDQVRARNWRILALGLMVANLIMGSGLVYAVAHPRVERMVIAVDKLQNVVGVSYPAAANQVSQVDIRTALSQWITCARTVSSDTDADASNLGYVYDRARGGSVRYLNDYYKGAHNDPRDRAEAGTVTVAVRSVLAQTPSTYIVQWTEEARDRGHRSVGAPRDYQALIQTAIVPSDDDVVALRNPHGIYIASVNWQGTAGLAGDGR